MLHVLVCSGVVNVVFMISVFGYGVSRCTSYCAWGDVCPFSVTDRINIFIEKPTILSRQSDIYKIAFMIAINYFDQYILI